MYAKQYHDKKLQNRLTLIPNSNHIWGERVQKSGNGGYFTDKTKSKDRNNTWQENHRLIIEYVERVLEGLGRLPTVKEISKELKISRVTVTNHLREFKANPAHQLERGMLDLMAEKVLLKAMQKAADFGTTIRDLRDALACYRIMNPVNNSDITINNVKIDIAVFNSLSSDKKAKIIEILTKEPGA
jgi:hypothetical protein